MCEYLGEPVTDNQDKKHSHDRSIAIGEKALGFIKYNQTSAAPDGYELWYSYASGLKPELNTKIKSILATQPRIEQTQLDELYSTYFNANEVDDRMEEISSKVALELNEVMEMVGSSLANTEGYSESLEVFTSELADIKDEGSLRMMISSMAAATFEMAQNTKELESNLANSQKQIMSLNKDIETIKTESMTDALTAIPNRKKFDVTLQKEVTMALDSDEPLCLVLTDIDHFKAFNDNHGHQTGDQVLRLVANILKTNVKGRDLAARYGGEEFAIILPQTKLEDAIIVAEQIRKAVMNKELVKKSTGEKLGRVTMSFGIAQFKPEDTVESIIAKSDKYLYAAKHAGRNNVQTELNEQAGQEEMPKDETAA